MYGQKYFQQTGRILNDIGFEIFGFHLIPSSGIIKIGRKIKYFFFPIFNSLKKVIKKNLNFSKNESHLWLTGPLKPVVAQYVFQRSFQS